MTLAAIGLGSNIDRGRALAPALRALVALPRTSLLRRSSWYGSAPWGGAQGGSFVNGAVLVDTGLAPGVLLGELRRIEAALGRLRGPRYGRRVVDLDLLCMEGVRLATPRLTLPHPALLGRRFVLQPLAEIAPELVVAPGLRAGAALARCPDRGRLWRVVAPGRPAVGECSGLGAPLHPDDFATLRRRVSLGSPPRRTLEGRAREARTWRR